jgi:hypothetical protein
MRGPEINHPKLQQKLRAAEHNYNNAFGHVRQFLDCIANVKAGRAPFTPELVERLKTLKAVVLAHIKENEDIEDWMSSKLGGLSDYQALLLRDGNPEELERLNSQLQGNKLVRKMKQIGKMKKGATIRGRELNVLHDLEAGRAETHRNKINYKQMLQDLNEARGILGVPPSPPTTPRNYDFM